VSPSLAAAGVACAPLEVTGKMQAPTKDSVVPVMASAVELHEADGMHCRERTCGVAFLCGILVVPIMVCRQQSCTRPMACRAVGSRHRHRGAEALLQNVHTVTHSRNTFVNVLPRNFIVTQNYVLQ
jgi:hypothetical protein